MSSPASVPSPTNESPAPIERYLEFADIALICVGVLVIVLIIVKFVMQDDRKRARLLPPTRSRLSLETLLLPMFAWVMVGAMGSVVVNKFIDEESHGLAMIYLGNFAHLAGGLMCLFVARFGFRGGWRRFFFGRGSSWKHVRTGVIGVLISFPICWGVLITTDWFIQQTIPSYHVYEHDVIDTIRTSDVPIWTLWIGTTLIAPFAEEVFFRGICQSFLMQVFKNRWPAILLIAVVFGAIHAGSERPQPHVVPALTALGLILGIVYARSRSLIAPIVLHALFNAKTLLWETLRAAT